ncbi:hypothetical protein R1flu_012378 [Riccia fluitans]|uniref:Transmembrane protein n=1 Tax=Riccia fluitans TaxID=41844 RepID=A0ABD1ZAS3_9MARC
MRIRPTIKHATYSLLSLLLSLWAVRFTHAVPPADDWSSIEKLENALRASTLLPLSSQKLILSKIGDALVAVGGGPRCNVFGGPDSCVSVPENSDYARFCKTASNLVDCAFEMEALEGIHKDPDAVMKDRLTNDNGDPPCPTCYAALHKFWCAQTVPACGTFDKVVDEILPMISSVALKKVTPVVAVQSAVPRMLQAASLGLPCRNMCNAITQTCGCDHPATFGEVMTSIHARNSDGFNTNMSSTTAEELFQNIWDKPVCDLFAEDTMPGFVGVCDVPAEESKCGWCSKKNHPSHIHEQIVAQIAQSFSGIMQGGLETILSEAGGPKYKGSFDSWNWDQQGGSNGSKNHGHTGVVTVLLLLLAVAIAALFGAIKLQRNRQQSSQYIDLTSMGYTPPVL